MKTALTLCYRTKENRGFTLLELLIALVIFGLLTSLGASLSHLGERSWEKTNAMSREISSFEAVQSLLRSELSGLYPAITTTDGAGQTAFDGTQDSLRFHASLPVALGNDGPAEIRLYIDRDGDGQKLVMAWRHDNNLAHWERSTLLSGVKEASFSYYGSNDDGSSRLWRSTWSNRKILPQTVKLDIDFSASPASPWPEFIVSPMINMDMACGYKDDLKRCWAQ